MLVSYKRYSNAVAAAPIRFPEDELLLFCLPAASPRHAQSEPPPPHAPLASEAASLRPAPAAA